MIISLKLHLFVFTSFIDGLKGNFNIALKTFYMEIVHHQQCYNRENCLDMGKIVLRSI